MAITAAEITTSNTLEQFRQQFNNLVTDVTGLESGTQTFTATTTTTSNVGNLNVLEDGTIVFEGATDDDHETTLTVVDPTADRTVSLPNASGTVIISDSSTDIVTLPGDLVVGSLLKMPTNTSGRILVADGTSYEEVAVSGDVTIASTGAVTIAATAVEGSMLNTDIISAQTELASGLADTDEILISDAGTLKRTDVSNLTEITDGSATALAIALG
tara:strand:- start:2704 stop:3351 length:648 start_codon:yes stop_codon:yes gene_type:complete